MHRLGISIYPNKSDRQKDIEYIEKAHSYGFSRIFTNLLFIDDNKKDKSLEEFRNLANYASSLGMEVIADVSPSVLKYLNIEYKDLSPFKQLGLTGLRLDMGFSGNEESEMSYNPYGLKIELNMSSNPKYIENIMSYLPNKDNLIGCHNFYPHRYTGLSRKHFMETSLAFKEYGLRTAAFVSSNNAAFGPWDVNEGLPTLEEHRFLPIDVQAKDLLNTFLIDDLIISNCYASNDELELLGNLNKDLLTFKVSLIEGVGSVEKKIILDELHFNRGDVNEYMIRSTQSRVKYKGHLFEPINTVDINRGDIIIESSQYEHYAGELQIALKSMKNSGKSSVVGRIREEELFLLDYVRSWQKFKFELL